MRIYAINGSPRKKWNTATILDHALAGAAGSGAVTEMINLYDLAYTGCTECFACKRLGSPSYGRCAVRDGLAPVLAKLLEADVIFFGTPIFFGDMAGMMRSFLERLLFPLFVYDKNYSSLAPRKVRTAFFYTMNVTQEMMEAWAYPKRLALMEGFAGRIFGHAPRVQYVNNTYQFSDYSHYKMEIFSEADKARQRETQFPLDCEKARELGAALAAEAGREEELA